jgi:autotransporter translocation and assembly factor TamB
MTHITPEIQNTPTRNKSIRVAKSLLWHLSVTPVSFFYNSIVLICLFVAVLFYNHNVRDKIIKTYLLPALEHYDFPKITYDSLFINQQNALIGNNLSIYDKTHKKFLSVDTVSIQPHHFFDIYQGFKEIAFGTVTVFKQPIFGASHSKNNTITPPKIPFDMNALTLKTLILKPALTGYADVLNLKINGNNSLKNGINLKIDSLDYKNASLKTHFSDNHRIITVDSTMIAPEKLLNTLFKNAYFKNTVTATLKGTVNIGDYLNNKRQAIQTNIQEFTVNDGKLNLKGNLKTALYPEPLAFRNTDIQLQSNKNHLIFKGDITEKAIHGNLKADNFNLVDFYPLEHDLKQFIITGNLNINGKINVIPNIDGTLNVKALYRDVPLSADIIGHHKNKASNIDLKLQTQNQMIADAHIDMNDYQIGKFNILLTPQNIPAILRQDIPVIVNDVAITSNFKRTLDKIVFSDGVLTLKKFKTKKILSDIPFTVQDLSLNFQNTPNALKINKATFTGTINQQIYNANLSSVLYDYYKPQSLHLSMIHQKNPAITMNVGITHINNRDKINIALNNVEPNALFATQLPLKITNLNAKFDGYADIFASDMLKTLSGTFETDARHDITHDDNASVALKGTLKNAITNAHYSILMNDKPAGTGTFTTSNHFNTLKTATDTDLKAISVFINNTEHRLTGKIIADIGINNGVLLGDISLKDATYRNLLYGTALDKINMQARLTDDYIDVLSLNAVSLPTGELSGKGKISLSPAIQSSLVLSTHDLVPMKNNMVNVNADSTIALAGNSNALQLTGTIKLNDLLILLPDLKTNDTPNLTIIRPNTETTQSQADTIPILERIQTDIAVSITEGAKIVGFGLEGFPFGTLQIQGTLGTPLVDGQINIARGSIELLSKSFKITSGGIHVKKNNPLFNIQAVHNVDNTEINLSLKGAVKNPDIVLSSKPAIPKDEIIALLFFGKNKNELSPFQGLRLANAVYQLSRGKSGAGGTFDVVGNTERLLNIDQLSVNSDANNSVSVGAGKYISDDIYLATDYNPSTSATAFRLELKLTDTLGINTRLNTSNKSTNNSEIMLRKNKDY